MSRDEDYGYNEYELWRVLRVIQNEYPDKTDDETKALIEALLDKLNQKEHNGKTQTQHK